MTQPTEQADARTELYAYTTVAFQETGVPPVVHAHVTRLLDAYRAAALREAADAAEGELLQDDTRTPEDEAYNQGVRDAIAAIKCLTVEDAR